MHKTLEDTFFGKEGAMNFFIEILFFTKILLIIPFTFNNCGVNPKQLIS